MVNLTLYEVEDLLNIPEGIETIKIGQDVVLRYLYNMKKNGTQNGKINIEALRSVYIKSINKSYKKNKYLDDINFSKKDVQKVCAML